MQKSLHFQQKIAVFSVLFFAAKKRKTYAAS